jgi:hypothetical protein
VKPPSSEEGAMEMTTPLSLDELKEKADHLKEGL